MDLTLDFVYLCSLWSESEMTYHVNTGNKKPWERSHQRLLLLVFTSCSR